MPEIIIPKEMTLKEWNEKYETDMQQLYFGCDDVLNLLFTASSVPSYIILWDYIRRTRGHMIFLPKFTGNRETDTSNISDLKFAVRFKSDSLLNKYKGLSAMVNQDWTLQKIEQLGYDYTITKTGSITDNLHVHTNKGEGTAGNKVTNKRSDTKTDNKARTYDGTEVDSSSSTTDYQYNGQQNETETDTDFDFNKDRTQTFSNYKEEGNKGKSLIEEFPEIIKFLNINLIEEYIKDTIPIYTRGVFKKY